MLRSRQTSFCGGRLLLPSPTNRRCRWLLRTRYQCHSCRCLLRSRPRSAGRWLLWPQCQKRLLLMAGSSTGMPHADVVRALAALAHDARLAVFKLLVQAGPDGLAAGVLAEQLAIAPSALSFHLKELPHAGLLVQRPR